MSSINRSEILVFHSHYNSPSPSLVDTVCFGLLQRSKPIVNRYYLLWLVMYRRQPHDFKTYQLGRGFHTLVRNVSFPSPTDVGSHNPSHLVARGFHTNVSFPSRTDVRFHNPSPLGVSILTSTPPYVWP